MLLDQIDKYTFYCYTLKELLADYKGDVGQLESVIEQFYNNRKHGEYTYVYIEDRGILFSCHYCYILQCPVNLTNKDILEKYFAEVEIINKHYNCSKNIIYTKNGTFNLTANSITKEVMRFLVDRFLLYSDHLYRNPFDLSSKKILYFGKERKRLKDINYIEICNAAAGAWGIVEVEGIDGIYYMDGGQLILAQPDLFDYLGSIYCRARYLKCIPSEDGGIKTIPTDITELAVIVDTVSLFKYNFKDIGASRLEHLKKNDFAYADSSQSKSRDSYVLLDSLTSNCYKHYVTFQLPVDDEDDEDNIEYLRVLFNYYDLYTTDLVVSAKVVQSDSPTDFIHDTGTPISLDCIKRVYLWRMLDSITVSSQFITNFKYAITPFSRDYEILITEDYSDTDALDILKKSVSCGKFRVLYNKLEDDFYFLNMRGFVLIAQKVICFGSNLRLYNVCSEVNDCISKTINGASTHWERNSGENWENFSLSHSLIQYVRSQFKNITVEGF